MEVEKQFISVDRFLEIVEQPQYDDRIVDLVEGEIVDMPLPSGEHGEILSLLVAKVASFVYGNKLGRVTTGDAGFLLERNPDGRDTIRGLDLAFISTNKAPILLPNRFLEIAPDLAVEVILPSNVASDIHLKIRQLLRTGTQLIWVVYPESKTVDVHTASGAFTLEENDSLSGDDVLPGLEIRVGDIFPS